jgi:hypothetical protein
MIRNMGCGARSRACTSFAEIFWAVKGVCAVIASASEAIQKWLGKLDGFVAFAPRNNGCIFLI